MRRPLLVTGFMASGKSSVGKRAAELAGRPFVDLDARIEARFGMPIARIFSDPQHGEAAFRQAEHDELTALLGDHTGPAPVVALGGGCLVRRELRLQAIDQAVVVSLQVSADEVVARVGLDTSRPNLAGDPRRRAEELLELRALAYAEAHERLATGGVSIDELASRAVDVWRRDPVGVAAGEASYAVDIGAGVAPARLLAACEPATALLLVSDQNVAPLHAVQLEALLRTAPKKVARLDFVPGEQHKNLASIQALLEAAQAAGLDRKSRLIALGGGVTTDMTGFAAASYLRGIGWVSVPTTLLAMVDASVGGKTGVDLGAAKNAVGAFWQPTSVLCDVDYLKTEPARGYRSALSEVVKTALIGDPELFELLEREAAGIAARSADLLTEIVRRCIRVKARIVSADPREAGLRAVLNLGHTVGHALEAQAGFERLTHGEAISLGLVAALSIGQKLGHTPRELAERTRRLLAALELMSDLAQEPLAAAAELIGHDKKRAGSRVSFVFARGLGDVVTVPLELSELRDLTRSLA
ncbi:MAG TPA: 3-dehydroquinate synthase [Polyangiaceae bacterium]